VTYLLDTNVVSELRKLSESSADANVTGWLSSRNASSFYISAITILELERGILAFQRRDNIQGERLRTWLETRVRPEFSGRILPIDDAIATRCAYLHIPDRRNEADALIAATALVHNLTVVTRNVRDFEGIGVAVFNPWHAVL
jgi:toxin FitB